MEYNCYLCVPAITGMFQCSKMPVITLCENSPLVLLDCSWEERAVDITYNMPNQTRNLSYTLSLIYRCIPSCNQQHTVSRSQSSMYILIWIMFLHPLITLKSYKSPSRSYKQNVHFWCKALFKNCPGICRCHICRTMHWKKTITNVN